MFRMQGNSKQLDLGAYISHDIYVVGLWYRGIPLKTNNILNNDAIIVMFGIKTNGVSIGYSYDLSVSKIGISSGGSHELSLVYDLAPPNPRRKTMGKPEPIACPQF